MAHPNRFCVLAGIVILCTWNASSDELRAPSPTAIRLKDLNGVVEQTYFSGHSGDYHIRQIFFDPKTGEFARFGYESKAPSLAEGEQLFNSLTSANADTAFFSLRLYDVCWDVKKRRWTKLPKEFLQVSAPPVSDQSVFFACYPLVAPRLHMMEKSLNEAGSQDVSARLRRNIQELQGLKGAYRVPLRNFDGTTSEYVFTVSDIGVVERLECWTEKTLHDLTRTRLLPDFPPIPKPNDTQVFDNFSKLNVNDNGMIGARVTTVGDELTIAEVWPGSPAAEAGMIQGEQVLTVNGRRLAAPTLKDFQDSLKGPPPVHIRTRTTTGGTKDYAVGKTMVIHSPPVMSSPIPSD